MGVFEHFPYVNFHELNLSWIVNKLKDLEDIIGSQIVDVVARAGVAANTQAINDLTTVVNNNAITAHNEAQAAANDAAAAQSTADGAVSSISTINTKLTKSLVTITKDSAIDNMEGWCAKDGQICSFYLQLTNGAVQLAGGNAQLATGLPIPYNGRVQALADITAGGNFDKVVKVAVQANGALTLWYGGNLPANEILTVQMTYMTA